MFWTLALREPVSLPRDVLPNALRGDYEAQMLVLNVLAESFRQNKRLSPQLTGYLAQAFRRLAEGDDATLAFFGTKRKKGQRDTRPAMYQALRRACAVAELRRKHPGRKQMTVDEAVAAVAADENASEETIRAAWRDHHHCIVLSTQAHTQLFFGATKKKRGSKSSV